MQILFCLLMMLADAPSLSRGASVLLPVFHFQLRIRVGRIVCRGSCYIADASPAFSVPVRECQASKSATSGKIVTLRGLAGLFSTDPWASVFRRMVVLVFFGVFSSFVSSCCTVSAILLLLFRLYPNLLQLCALWMN